MRYRPEMMTKKYVCEVQAYSGSFRVYTAGRERYVLFCPLDAHGGEGEVRIAVSVRDLRDDVAYAVRHGLSYDARGGESR